MKINHRRQKKLTIKSQSKKMLWVMLILTGFLFFLCVNLVSAFEFDNIKSDLIKNKDTSEYGMIEIRNTILGIPWFQLDRVMSLELKENTEVCFSRSCSANTTIIMYEDGKLIDDIRFLDLKTGEETIIKDYEIYVNGDLYNGEKVRGYSDGVKYNVELKGNLHPFQQIDWQIRSANTGWIENWAVWTDSLTNGTIAYWKFDESSGTNVEDHMGYYDLTTNSTNWTTGRINNGLAFNSTGRIATNDTFLDDNNTDLSFSFWFKLDKSHNSTGVTTDVWRKINKDNLDEIRVLLYSDGLLYVFIRGEGSGSVNLKSNTSNWEPGLWYNPIIIWDGRSNVTLYINGQLNHSTVITATLNSSELQYDFAIGGNHSYADFWGTIDEFGVWNRTLLDSEITDLYNSGSGISPLDVPVVTLNSPADNFNTTNKNIIFNCTAAISVGLNITNVSLYHNESGTWTLNQTNSTTRKQNSTSIFDVTFQDYESIEWNCYACGSNSECAWGINKTLNLERLVIESETYNPTAYETATESIIINISYISSEFNSISAILYYNGTEYLGEESGTGDSLVFSRTFDIPLLSGTVAQDKSFNWIFTLTDALGTYYYNSSVHTQSVTPIALGDCTGALTNITLNFTAWDEEELTRIKGFDFKATFFYWLGNGAYMKNASFNNLSVYEKNICINPSNVTYYLINSDIEYTSNFTGYVTRNYYFENDTINNVTQHVLLYLLNSSDSTSFILKVVDQNQQDVENALIYTQRYFPGLGKYRIVQIAKTDENGKSIGFFKTETVDYRFIIERNGTIEFTSSRQKVIPEETPYTLTFTIGEAMEKPWIDFDDLNDLDYTLVFNSSTNITTFTYIDTSGNFTQGRLLVKELKYNGTDIVICNGTSANSAATLTCDASGYSGTFTAQGLIKRTTERTVSLVSFAITTVVEVLGKLGLFLGWWIILVAGCAFFWHPIAGVVGIESAIIFVNLIGLVSFSPLFIFGSLAIAIILIFVLKD